MSSWIIISLVPSSELGLGNSALQSWSTCINTELVLGITAHWCEGYCWILWWSTKSEVERLQNMHGRRLSIPSSLYHRQRPMFNYIILLTKPSDDRNTTVETLVMFHLLQSCLELYSQYIQNAANLGNVIGICEHLQRKKTCMCNLLFNCPLSILHSLPPKVFS